MLLHVQLPVHYIAEDSCNRRSTCAGLPSAAQQPVLQLMLDRAHKAKALGTDQGICPVRQVNTSISMLSAVFVDFKQGKHLLSWWDTTSLIGAVLCRHQRRLTKDHLTRCKALHVQR